jgi:hypothetical protein
MRIWMPLCVVLSSILLFSFVFSANASLSWTTSIVDTNGILGAGISIALDSNNNPHICYTDYKDGNPRVGPAVLMYASWNGSGWNTQPVAVNGVTTNTGLALDSNGNPHIAYSVKDSLMYASWTGTNWTTQTIDSSTVANSINSPSLALDSAGNPHIAYCYQPYGAGGYPSYPSVFKYASWTGTNWTIQTVDTIDGLYPVQSFALDSSNNPHIVCGVYNITQVVSPGIWIVKYATLNGQNWSIQTVPPNANITSLGNVAVDTEKFVHFTYSTGQSLNTSLVYASWNGSGWNMQTVDSLVGDSVAGALALDSQGNPHISYVKGTLVSGNDNTQDILAYAQWTGESWDTQTANSTSYIIEASGALALDSNGHPCAGYFWQPIPASYMGNVMYSATAESTQTPLPSPTVPEFSSGLLLLLLLLLTLVTLTSVDVLKRKGKTAG